MHVAFEVEKWSDVLPELRPMFHMLWDDVGVDKDKFIAKCDEAKYKTIEDAGLLCVTTMRADGHLVGFYVAIVHPNPHYFEQGMMAYTDMYFLLPGFRRGNWGLKLFAFTEEEWKKRGAVKAYSSHKIHRDRGRMFEALGWRPLDIVYSKIL